MELPRGVLGSLHLASLPSGSPFDIIGLNPPPTERFGMVGNHIDGRESNRRRAEMRSETNLSLIALERQMLRTLFFFFARAHLA